MNRTTPTPTRWKRLVSVVAALVLAGFGLTVATNVATPQQAAAASWHLIKEDRIGKTSCYIVIEQQDGTNNKYRAYTYTRNGTKLYLKIKVQYVDPSCQAYTIGSKKTKRGLKSPKQKFTSSSTQKTRFKITGTARSANTGKLIGKRTVSYLL